MKKTLKELSKEFNYLKERQKGDYTAIEKAWDNLSRDEQMNIVADAMNGEPRPNDYEKGFDQLKSEIPDFESAIAKAFPSFGSSISFLISVFITSFILIIYIKFI